MEPSSTIFVIGTALELYARVVNSNVKDYGYVRGLALETVFFQARRVVGRIRSHVISKHEDSAGMAGEAWSIKDSYAASLNMVAVAVSNQSSSVSHLLELISSSGSYHCANSHHSSVFAIHRGYPLDSRCSVRDQPDCGTSFRILRMYLATAIEQSAWPRGDEAVDDNFKDCKD